MGWEGLSAITRTYGSLGPLLPGLISDVADGSDLQSVSTEYENKYRERKLIPESRSARPGSGPVLAAARYTHKSDEIITPHAGDNPKDLRGFKSSGPLFLVPTCMWGNAVTDGSIE